MYQLRIHEVDPNKRDAFHARFKDHAAPLMKKYGFTIIAMWESTTATDFEFAYILQWPDTQTMERQWRLFLADGEWIRIKKEMDNDIGEPIRRATSRTLEARPSTTRQSSGYGCPDVHASLHKPAVTWDKGPDTIAYVTPNSPNSTQLNFHSQLNPPSFSQHAMQ